MRFLNHIAKKGGLKSGLWVFTIILLVFCLLAGQAYAAGPLPHDTAGQALTGDSAHPIFKMLPKVRHDMTRFPVFYLFIFGGGLVMLAVIRLLAPAYLRELFLSVFDLKIQLNAFHESRFGFNFMNLLLDLLAIAMLSIIVDQYFLHGRILFGWVVAFTGLAYFLKLILVQFFANVFFGRGEALVHLLLHLLLTRIMGIILLPILFVVLYQTYMDHMQLLYYLICIVGLIYTGWLFRLFVKMKSLTVSGIFYVFLYLCTIELSPLAIVLKDYIR